jgi:hypothetical protein
MSLAYSVTDELPHPPADRSPGFAAHSALGRGL